LSRRSMRSSRESKKAERREPSRVEGGIQTIAEAGRKEGEKVGKEEGGKKKAGRRKRTRPEEEREGMSWSQGDEGEDM
jgi:hypothetical protein